MIIHCWMCVPIVLLFCQHFSLHWPTRNWEKNPVGQQTDRQRIENYSTNSKQQQQQQQEQMKRATGAAEEGSRNRSSDPTDRLVGAVVRAILRAQNGGISHSAFGYTSEWTTRREAKAREGREGGKKKPSLTRCACVCVCACLLHPPLHSTPVSRAQPIPKPPSAKEKEKKEKKRKNSFFPPPSIPAVTTASVCASSY